MKLRYFILPALSLLTLTTCSSGGIKITGYEKIYVLEQEEELMAAVDAVEESNVLLVRNSKFSSGWLSGDDAYDFSSAVVYKHSGNKYYAVTEYDSGDEDSSVYSIILGTDYNNKISASMVGYDLVNRIAVYSFNYSGDITVSEISATYDSEIGERVFSIASRGGNAHSLSSYDYETNAYCLYRDILQFTNGLEITTGAMSQDENKGSAIYDYNGKLIGLNTYKVAVGYAYGGTPGSAGTEETSNLNYAIRNDKLYTIVNQIESAGGAVSRPSLGFDLKAKREANPYYADYVFYKNYLREYAYIEGEDVQPYFDYKVSDDTLYTFPDGIKFGLYYNLTLTTSSFGLEKGDLITKINGEEINTLNEFLSIFNVTLRTDSVTLTVYRGGVETTLNN